MNTEVPSEVDIIIAGGGATGCLLASRLAAAYPTVSILLVEAGPSNRDAHSIRIPALWAMNLAPGSEFIKYHISNHSDKLGGRPVPVAVPNVLGGGGSVNSLVYARGLEEDFEGWAWPKEELVELLKKIEKYMPAMGASDDAAHGTKGEFVAGHGGGFSGYKMWVDDFLQAARKAGFPVVPDSQNLKTSDGISSQASWVNPSTGQRQDGAHNLLHPLLDSGKTKLHVLTDHSVVRVLFSPQKKCIGLEAISTKSATSTKTFHCTNQVILCTGTINSPQILERSGIGSSTVLSSLKIPVVSPLSGVGTNYQDHQFISARYKSSAPLTHTLDALWSGKVSSSSPEIQASGILGWNGGIIAGKIRPSATELALMSERFQSLYKRDFEKQNKPLALVYAFATSFGPPIPPEGQYISTAVSLAHSYSTGHVHIKSIDLKDALDFNEGSLSDADGADLEVLVWAYKRSREMVRRMQLATGGWQGVHPKFSETSDAGIEMDNALVEKFRETSTEGHTVLKDIKYTYDDNKVIEEYVKETVGTFWHYAGTCAMKPQTEGGVVDSNLNVYGVDGLKVADLSILPSLVAGNTYATALMVGEKATKILLKEMGDDFSKGE